MIEMPLLDFKSLYLVKGGDKVNLTELVGKMLTPLTVAKLVILNHTLLLVGMS